MADSTPANITTSTTTTTTTTTSTPATDNVNLRLVIIIQSVMIVLLFLIVIGIIVFYCVQKIRHKEVSERARSGTGDTGSNQIPPDQTYRTSNHYTPRYDDRSGNTLPTTELPATSPNSTRTHHDSPQPGTDHLGYDNDVFDMTSEGLVSDNSKNERKLEADVLSPTYAYHVHDGLPTGQHQGSTLPGYRETPFEVVVARSEASDEDYRKPKKSRHLSTFQPKRPEERIPEEEGGHALLQQPMVSYFPETRSGTRPPVLGVDALKQQLNRPKNRNSSDFETTMAEKPKHRKSTGKKTKDDRDSLWITPEVDTVDASPSKTPPSTSPKLQEKRSSVSVEQYFLNSDVVRQTAIEPKSYRMQRETRKANVRQMNGSWRNRPLIEDSRASPANFQGYLDENETNTQSYGMYI